MIRRYFLTAVAGAGVASAVLLALGIGSSAAHHTTQAAGTPKLTTIASQPASPSSTLTASQIYQRDSAGVVAIQATSAQQQDSGTGVVLNNSGLILTNDHVISGASTVTVSPGNSSTTTRTAQVVGEDPSADLALIKIDASGINLHPLALGNSSATKVGDPVYAIGSPYGLNETLTTGIVSSVGRQISAPNGASISDVIQTDAALNPGNSGGPLISAKGEVIGINSQIASDAAASGGGQPGSTGVGFAISSNTVAQLLTKLENGGTQTDQSPAQTQQTQPGATQSPYGYADPNAGGGGPGYLIVPGGQ